MSNCFIKTQLSAVLYPSFPAIPCPVVVFCQFAYKIVLYPALNLNRGTEHVFPFGQCGRTIPVRHQRCPVPFIISISLSCTLDLTFFWMPPDSQAEKTNQGYRTRKYRKTGVQITLCLNKEMFCIPIFPRFLVLCLVFGAQDRDASEKQGYRTI